LLLSIRSQHTRSLEIYTFPYTTLFRSVKENQKELIQLINAYSLLAPCLIDALFVPQTAKKYMAQKSETTCFSNHLTVIYCLSAEDRKSTRLNSSHVSISYAVFCLKKKK